MKSLVKPQNFLETKLNLKHVRPRHLPRSTWLIRHKGRWRKAGCLPSEKDVFHGWGNRNIFGDLSQRPKIQDAWKF